MVTDIPANLRETRTSFWDPFRRRTNIRDCIDRLRRRLANHFSPGGEMNVKSEFITEAPLNINIPVDRSYKSASMRK